MNVQLYDEVVEWLEKEKLPTDRTTTQQKRSFKNFCKPFQLIEGRLMKKTKWSDPVKVVKQGEEDALLFLYHDDPTAGHLGEKKIMDRLKRNFFWPNMRQDIKDYVKTCYRCQMQGKPNNICSRPNCTMGTSRNQFHRTSPGNRKRKLVYYHCH